MRSSWLEFVKRTRVRENRGKKSCSYREAMKIASETWPKEKAKIERRIKREKGSCPEKGKPPRHPAKPAVQMSGSRSVENAKAATL